MIDINDFCTTATISKFDAALLKFDCDTQKCVDQLIVKLGYAIGNHKIAYNIDKFNINYIDDNAADKLTISLSLPHDVIVDYQFAANTLTKLKCNYVIDTQSRQLITLKSSQSANILIVVNYVTRNINLTIFKNFTKNN